MTIATNNYYCDFYYEYDSTATLTMTATTMEKRLKMKLTKIKHWVKVNQRKKSTFSVLLINIGQVCLHWQFCLMSFHTFAFTLHFHSSVMLVTCYLIEK